MTRDLARPPRHDGASANSKTRPAGRRFARTLTVEPLEVRTLLSSFYTGPTASRSVITAGSVYTLSVSGPGYLKVKPAGHGVININLLGTTDASTLTETLKSSRLHKSATALQIGSIDVVSGVVGNIDLPDASLSGKTTVAGAIGSFTVGGLTTNAQVSIPGALQSLSVGSIDLGATGSLDIAGGISQSITVGSLNLDGGKFSIGGDVTGSITFGQVSLTRGGEFSVGRDVTGTLTVAGGLSLATNGVIAVGRDLAGLTVDGDLTVAPSGGVISIGGNLATMTVSGTFQGKGAQAPDLIVGLDLDNFTVNGGAPGTGGLDDASIEAGKNIQGFEVVHGIFNSLITAGVLIDGTNTNTSDTDNIGPDGVDAVYNSQILAGLAIDHFTIGGNVDSTFATNPTTSTGYPTRIVAGVTRDGTYTTGGFIDNFQITGSLIDSVLAAAVAPSGGNGTLPTLGYGSTVPASAVVTTGTYDAPAGVIVGGTVGAPVAYPNYSEVSIYNEMVTGVSYNTTLSPTINDLILPGSINQSFITAPLTQSQLTNTQTVTNTSSSGTATSGSGSSTTTTITPSEQILPLPSKSTVLGGVISTAHAPTADFAGIFAADTRGVFVGALPSSS